METSRSLFWLSDEAWAAIEPHLPKNQPGARRVDVLGRPLRLILTPVNTSDVKGADLLIGETVGMKRVIADRG